MALSLLGSATWSVLDFVRTDLRTVRLAIANGDRSDRAMHPRKSQAVTPIRLLRRQLENERSRIAPCHPSQSRRHPPPGNNPSCGGRGERASLEGAFISLAEVREGN